MNELQQAELQEWEEQPVEERERFKVNSLATLNDAFNKLASYKAKEKEIAELARLQREKIDNWEAAELKPIKENIDFFQRLIQTYHAQRLAENPNVKTLSTPFGKSKSRTSKPAPEKINEEKLVEYVFENDITEYLKYSVKWGDLKKTLNVVQTEKGMVVIDPNGQIVPGVAVKPEQTTFTIEVAE